MAYFHKDLKYHEDTKVKRAISKDDIDFLKALQKERNTQDNCGTADVRTWVIKTRDDKQGNEDSFNYIVLYNPCECRALDTDDIYNELMEYVDNHNDLEVENIVYNADESRLIFDYDGYRSAEIYMTDDGNDSIYINEDALEFIQEYLYSEDVRICYMQVDWKREFCFLTQKAAENYLKRKGHNHSKDAHTYCICTYQDPEIARLMDIIESTDWDSVNTTKTTEDKEFVHKTILTACELALKYCNTYAGDDEESPFNEQDIKDIKLLRKLEKERG